VTWQEAEELVPERLQVPAGLPLNVPDPLLEKLTVPDGVVGLAEVSVTIAVHVAAVPAETELGEQETEVVVGESTKFTVTDERPTSVMCVTAALLVSVAITLTVKVPGDVNR
jgi:hypothetical protein